MLRRSHKKSRAGCLECKRRHVKCDEQRPKCIICTLSERECSYPPQAPVPSNAGGTPSASPAASASLGLSSALDAAIAAGAAGTVGMASPVAGVPLPDLAGGNPGPPQDPSADQSIPEVNLGHMELLIRFNFEEHAPELNVEMHEFSSKLLFKCALEAPYLMHQILAVSSRRLALLHPDRAGKLLDEAIRLQTKAVSIYNETAAKAQIDQTNCSALLLFCSLLGRHLLADLLARRDGDFEEFLSRFLEFVSISRGLMAMSVAAWDLLLQSDIRHLVLWALEISRSAPRGHHCDGLQRLVAESTELAPSAKEACMAAIAYLQVGFDSLLGGDTRNQRYLMVFMWLPAVPQAFADLLSQRRPEALAIVGHWALMLHYTRSLWQVGGSGIHLLTQISEHLGHDWRHWLEWPLSVLAAAST
ncbi:hypothetical protein VTJ83DRAFT_2469 [Remersonia thermophila]|uniref:Zn(2)-C6 fungal-type domain-containing protein n=1 Tax=Remersonia thermophila TaxID=72144 RepID=A0ABR4DJF8_9PEZI